MSHAEAVALASWLAVDTDCTIRKVSTGLTIYDIHQKHFTVPAIHFINYTGHAGYSTITVPSNLEIDEHDVVLHMGQYQMDVGSGFGNAKPPFGVIERHSGQVIPETTFRFRYNRARLEPDGPEEVVISAEKVSKSFIADALRLVSRFNTARMAELGIEIENVLLPCNAMQDARHLVMLCLESQAMAS
ncbi:hypothetical protein BO82DRAFT_360487 [Aspergillus uvarum CBS 121591]|uniref:Uncharacterized protein n=1 Tax=Aspergillus uvarum CBS 121591 TaxID=1448315 RepID=A0A319DFD8_9EURO|nr:hypothetical protein BO82DRAFT_360487 [Aspergillus uvarum CBS 121591]PYH86748.1 hypothetical protein BO82DRAFT_360487 [Aspergillus uvarum CBS 121591]